MRSADAALRALTVAFLIVGSVQAAEPQYGKVETFQPGKKYTCLPTADHKAWDCREAASKDSTAARQDVQPATATAPLPPVPAAPAASAVAAPANVAATSTRPPANTASTAPAAAPAAHGASLPPYLRDPAARGPSAIRQSPAPASEPPAQAAARPEPPLGNAEPTAAEPAQPSTQTLPPKPAAPVATVVNERESASSASSTSAPAHDAPHTEPAATRESAGGESQAAAPVIDRQASTGDARPPPTPSAARPPVAPAPEAAQREKTPTTPAIGTTGRSGNNEFLALPGSGYIVELAHGANKSELDTLRAALRPAHGALYELHLLRDGADWWLLVWGTFDSVDAARAARNELPSDTPLNAGWPRPVAPLQKEARRAAD